MKILRIIGGLLFAVIIVILSLGIFYRYSIKSDIAHNIERFRQEKFNSTLETRYFSKLKNKEENYSFYVPDDDSPPLDVNIRNRALFGQARILITDKENRICYQAYGKNFGAASAIPIEKGEYYLTIDLTKARFGACGVGLKGNFFWNPELDPEVYFSVKQKEGEDFHWPFLLYVPKENVLPVLLVIPNNSGQSTDDFRIHEIKARRQIIRMVRDFGGLGVPILIPIFHRSKSDWRIYTHALDRDCLLTEKRSLKRLDLQLLAMIDHASNIIHDKGQNLGKKILLFGFSASGMFVNRFSFLHPDRVLAVASGSPGGWPIIPVEDYKGQPLRYPIGIADITTLTGTEFDLDGVRRVPMFLFLGAEDSNDSVIYRDSYEKDDEGLIFALFGETLQQRWVVAEEIYASSGCMSRFKTYEGVGHDITNEMKSDIIAFYKEQIDRID